MLNETERKILDVLISKSDKATRTVIIDINDLAKQTKKSHRTVYRYIKSMSEKRVIEKIDKQLFKINYSYKIIKIQEIENHNKQKQNEQKTNKINLEDMSTEELRKLLSEVEKELKRRKKEMRKEKKEKRYLSI